MHVDEPDAYSPSHIEVMLPEGHRFPMAKYAMLDQKLQCMGWRIEPAGSVDLADVCRVHLSSYVERWLRQEISPQEERNLGLPASPSLLKRSLHSMGGTLLAMQQAFTRGVGINLAGGTHHAFRDRGEGFCVFNDLAIATQKALAAEQATRVLIVDLDVHQGNGTARIFADHPSVFTFSMHGERNYPFIKEQSRSDVGLPDGIGDADYLAVLEQHLPTIVSTFKPDLMFLQGGVDVLAGDRFGRMMLSREGLVQRDEMVYTICRAEKIPLVYTMGGGYQPDLNIVVDAHAASLTRLREVFGW